VSVALTLRRSAFAALLRRPRYPSFVLTVSLTRIAGTMFMTSGVLLVLERTGSAPLAGATAAAATLPGALTAPLLGAWLDVARRRRALIALDQLLSVAGLAAMLALVGHAPDWTVLAAGVLYSITRPLSLGSFFSAIAELAGPELLDAASAVEATSLNLAFVIGPALAGALAGATSAATAVRVQIALTLVATVLIVRNRAFEARAAERAAGVRDAFREGVGGLRRSRILRTTGISSVLAAFGWGLMAVGFPLYAARDLHAGVHAGGYLWAAMALGSTVGTFVLRRDPSPARIAASYGVLGCSALLWPLAGSLAPGVALIMLTGALEGPAYSGTIALRQRHAPAAVRAQLMTTLVGFSIVASSSGAAIGGVVHSVWPLIAAFVVVNASAALVASRGRQVSAGASEA
jgi:MFS family permease